MEKGSADEYQGRRCVLSPPRRGVFMIGGAARSTGRLTLISVKPRVAWSSMCDAVLSTFALEGIVGSRAKPLLIRVEWIELMTTQRAPVLG